MSSLAVFRVVIERVVKECSGRGVDGEGEVSNEDACLLHLLDCLGPSQSLLRLLRSRIMATAVAALFYEGGMCCLASRCGRWEENDVHADVGAFTIVGGCWPRDLTSWPTSLSVVLVVSGGAGQEDDRREVCTSARTTPRYDKL